MEKITDIFFYSLERSIKTYRQFAQSNLVKYGFNVTIDQWLVLKALKDNPDWTQHQIAETIFKDYASVTRMIDLLVKKQYLTRLTHHNDRRRFSLTLTKNAINLLQMMQPVIENNRKIALNGITTHEIAVMQESLNTIINNCK